MTTGRQPAFRIFPVNDPSPVARRHLSNRRQPAGAHTMLVGEDEWLPELKRFHQNEKWVEEVI